MKGKWWIILAVLLLFLTGCKRGEAEETLVINTLAPGETPRPAQATAIRRATQTQKARSTRTLRPTRTPQPTLTPTRTPTRTPTPTLTPTPAPMLNVLIVTCDTGFNLLNRLGEVTNAYVKIQNVGQVDVSQVKVTLIASDREAFHPDETYTIQHLPAGYEIVLKMTADTQTRQETSLKVTLETLEGAREEAEKQSCLLRSPDQDVIDSLGDLFTVRKIESLP